jgi:hypothetical protein
VPRFGRSYPIRPLITEFFGATADVTGTATASITETDIVDGSKTIIIELTGDTWKSAFDAQRQAIINGLDAATSPTNGWNDEVRDKEVVTAVVRTSSTVVTITLTASALYDIASTETITVTVPAAAVDGAAEIDATPTFTVDAVVAGAIFNLIGDSGGLVGSAGFLAGNGGGLIG